MVQALEPKLEFARVSPRSFLAGGADEDRSIMGVLLVIPILSWVSIDGSGASIERFCRIGSSPDWI